MNSKLLCFTILLFLAFGGCSDNDDTITSGLDGLWKLDAVYYDPGDGSGDFVRVNSNKTLQIFENGEIVATGDLCTLSEDSGAQTMASYNAELQEIYVPGCQGMLQVMTTLNYQLDGIYLDIYYQCIEGCAHRYKKVSG